MSTDRGPAWTRSRVAAFGAALLVALCVTRFAGLHDRLLHHDEMVHAWMSDRLAYQGTYTAAPAYHAPLLYHLEAGTVRLFGAGTWRAVPAAAGIAAVLLLVTLAWRESGRQGAIGVAVLATLSPSWLYYSRFNAHDSLILLMTALVAWGRWHWDRGAPRPATWLIVVALALAWSTKLNAAFIVAAIALWPLVRRVASRGGSTLPALVWPRWPTMAAAIGAGLVIMAALFFTTYQAHRIEGGPIAAASATVQAAFVDPIAYWSRSHYQQRLGGPFHFYGALILIYEPLLVLGAVLAIGSAWRRRPHPIRRAAILLATGIGLAAALRPLAAEVDHLLHVHPVHFAVIPLGLAALWSMLRARGLAGDSAGLWWAWMASTQTLLYSYAGEKMPWLTVHIVLPWLMLAGPALARWWAPSPDRRALWAVRGVMIAAGLLTAWGAASVATWNRSDVGEPLVQLEYSPDAQAVFARIGDACARAAPPDGVCLVTTSEAQWPAQWHLRRFPKEAVATGIEVARGQTPFIFAPAGGSLGAAYAERFSPTHDAQRVRFATWGTWTQWLHRPQPLDVLDFWIRRRSLGPRRSVVYELWVRRDLLTTWRDDTARDR